MKKETIFIIYIILILNLINGNEYLKGIYNIQPKTNGLFPRLNRHNFIRFRNLLKYNYRIIPVDSGLYYLEYKDNKTKLGLDSNNKLSLIYNIDNVNNIYWNFIKIKDNEYLIKNNKTKNFLQMEDSLVKCSKDISEIIDKTNYTNISSSFIFKLVKIYEEVEADPKYLKYIDEEPIDIVIKYIDLTDVTLNREGIKQIFKDQDHEELRYSVRSIFDNIPWFRKIFIVMPNEKVKYFKSQEEIKDRIVYIKDKDVIGYDSADIYNFLLRLWNLSKFNVSENFIYMDDDYFIGKPLKKSDFFYYDEEQKKVLPNIVSDGLEVLNKEKIYREYNKYFEERDKINPHTAKGWKLHTLSVYKLLFDNFPEPLKDGGFTHNTLSMNIKDIKEIYDFVKNKYKYANETLNAKIRNVYDLQVQTLYNTYVLNIKKRKIHPIKRKFIELKELKKSFNLNYDLFVINTSGELKYSNSDFINLKKTLELKFNKPTPYENMSYVNDNLNIFNKNYELNENENDLNLKIDKLEKNLLLLITNEKRKRKNNDFYLIVFISIGYGLFIIVIIIIIIMCLRLYNCDICYSCSKYSLINKNNDIKIISKEDEIINIYKN